MPPKDLSGELASDDKVDFNFPAPSEEDWKRFDAAGADADRARETAEEQPDAEEPEAPEKPAAAAKPATTPAAGADTEVTLPDGSKMKLSEIVALRAGQAARQADAAVTPEQKLAQQMAKFERDRRAFEELQKQHRAGIQEILRDPAKYRELQQAAGINREPHPVREAQAWVQHRFNQYIEKGWKPEEVKREMLLSDLSQAQTVINGRELAELRSQLETQRRDVEDQKHFESVTKELEGLYARPEFVYAATPEGRDQVDALLAQADRDGSDVSLEEIVRKVHEFGARLIQSYTGTKKAQANATRKIMGPGGSHRAPEPKDYGSGYDGFNAIARDRMKGGG